MAHSLRLPRVAAGRQHEPRRGARRQGPPRRRRLPLTRRPVQRSRRLRPPLPPAGRQRAPAPAAAPRGCAVDRRPPPAVADAAPSPQPGGSGYQGGRGGSFGGAGFPPPPPPLDKAALKAKPPARPAPPQGCAWYETMLAIRPDSTAAERQEEVAAAVGVLERGGATALSVSQRSDGGGATPTAYPLKGHRSAVYVQMSYAAPAEAVTALHAVFATKTAGRDPVRLRHLTLRLE